MTGCMCLDSGVKFAKTHKDTSLPTEPSPTQHTPLRQHFDNKNIQLLFGEIGEAYLLLLGVGEIAIFGYM